MSRAIRSCRLVYLLAGLLLLAVPLGGCGAPPGGSCEKGDQCEGGVCLTAKEGFPGGYCSASCELTACPQGEDCRDVGGRALCLSRCSDGGGCRAGYQCFQGVCRPPCTDDESCGPGFLCGGGRCEARPGGTVGTSCVNDDDCAASACVAGACAQPCDRDAACPEGETCTLDRDADTLRSTCVAKRGGEGPLGDCTADDDCDRGTCLMGACLLHCQTPQDCDGDAKGRSCTGLPAPLRALQVSEWPTLRACLPRNQNLTVTVTQGRNLLVPDTARGVLLFTSVAGYNESFITGLTTLRDAAGTRLYQSPADEAAYFSNLLRGRADLGCSALLLSSSPTRVPLRPGAYPFTAAAVDGAGAMVRHEVQATYKLHDAPLLSGRVPLRVHITNLSGLPSTCSYRTLDAGSAPRTLEPFMRRLREILQQEGVGITPDPITFVDSDAATSINAGDLNSLNGVLRQASQQTTFGLDLVLVRTISPGSILGIAGGVPASPGLKGTPHTGAAVSVYALCIARPPLTLERFATVVAHELGHTLGLSHSREQSGQSDPLGDGPRQSESYLMDAANLMYWSADEQGSALTAEQGVVLRSMPQVQP